MQQSIHQSPLTGLKGLLRKFWQRRRWSYALLLCPGLSVGLSGLAQNINRPNKTGPMGMEVNTKTGNVFLSRTDVYIPARQLDLDFTFAYNSANYNRNTGYGNGWILDYNLYYRLDSTGQVILVWGDGREDAYAPVSGGFKAPTGVFDSLAQYQTGNYLLRQTDGVVYYFTDASHKHLTKMTEPNGNYLNFTYTNSLLTGIGNAAGQSVSLAYSNGRLSSVTDANAEPVQTYTYVYDGYGNLTKVTDPMGGTYKYTYLVNGPMSSITDKNANVADVVYYSGYAARELISCNSRTGFSYDTATHTTTVIDFMENGGNQTTSYVYDDKGWLTNFTGSCCGYKMEFTYDNSGNLLTRKDGNGNVYKYTYDNRGNYLTVTDPLNNTTSLAYTTDFNQIAAIVDPKGNTYSTTYDAAGNPVQMTRPGGSKYSLAYAANGDLLSAKDGNNNTTTFQYDAAGYPQKMTAPLNMQLQTGFDGRGNLVSGKDANGNNYAFLYDSLNRLNQVTDALNRIVKMAYDKSGNRTAVTDANGFKQTLGYDASDREVNYKDAKGAAFSLLYDAANNITQFTDALGNKTNFAYDRQNRLAVITDAAGNGYSFSYDGVGNLVSAQMPNGNTMNYNYDALNRIVSGSDAIGTLGSLAYDKNGNVTSFTNAAGATVSFAYDNLNRLTKTTDPLGNARVFTYNNNDNLLMQKDRNNNVSSYAYNALNRTVSFTDNNDNVVSLAYDPAGNVTGATDQNGNATTYQYDAGNRPFRMIYPDGSYVQVTYDNNNNVTAARLADGSVVGYAYDSTNRLIAKSYPDGSGFTYTYDGNGRLLLATSNTGSATYAFDGLGRVLAETFNNHTTAYSYNTAVRTISMTYPNGTAVTKTFDPRWRMTNLSVNGQTTASYSYNGVNQLLQKSFGNGITTTYQYDNMNRLGSFSSGNNGLPSLSFGYDNEGNKTVVARTADPQYSETFAYDAGYRLVTYKQGPLNGNSIPSPLVQNSYAYDAVGNRRSAVLNGVNTSYAVNNLNQYTSVNGVNFTYDGRGNKTYDGNFYMRYDAQGRKVADSAAGTVLHYAYDALGRRTAKSVNAVPVNYYYAGLNQIEERDGADSNVGTQIFEGSFLPLLRTTAGRKYFHHLNDMGSTEAMTDSTGALRERYRYDDFGRPAFLNAQGATIASSAINNRFLYTGQEYEAQSRNYQFYFRNYDPATGTFSQRDPIGYSDQMGLYQYVRNNPGSLVDPLGLAPCPPNNVVLNTTTSWESWLNSLFYTSAYAYNSTQYMRYYLKEVQWNRLQKLMELGKFEEAEALGAKLEKIIPLNQVKQLARFQKASMTFDGIGSSLGKFGTRINQLDVGLKGAQFAKTLYDAHNGNADYTDIAMSGGNLGQSALGFTGVGTVYNIGDFLQSQVTGKSMNEWAAEEGKAQADVYNEEHGYNSVEEKEAEWHREKGDFKEWWETRKKMIRRQHQWKQNHQVPGGDGCPPNGPTPGTQNPLPPPPGQPGQGEVIFEHDPNEIIGPDGVGAARWVSVNDRLPYTVLFENAKEATAPAKVVKVFYPMDPKQDMASFQLGSFGFNNLTFNVPANANAYYKRLDVRDSLNLYVDVTAGIDAVSKQAFWIFESIDPVTLLPTSEPLKGFLLTADSTNVTSGHGFVNFSIKPVANAATGDTISVYAGIVFGTNDTIPTNRTKNTVDALPPVSSLAGLPAVTPDTRIDLPLSGADDTGGSGLKWYSIYVSDNGGALQRYVDNFSKADTSFRGLAKHTYRFYADATDSAGNREQTKLAGTVRITDGEEVICPGGNVTFVAANGAASYQWQVDTGRGYANLAEGGVYSGTASATLTLTGAATNLYGYRYRAVMNGTAYSTEYLLKFGTTWEGTVSNAWEVPANWSCGSLPDAATDVTIGSEKVRYPQVSAGTAIRSLATQAGATVTVKPGVVLTIVK